MESNQWMGGKRMNSFSSFGECIKAMLESRELSLLEGARLMNMKSATSLSRIIHNEVNVKTLDIFYQALLENQRISILPEEKAQLDQALSIQRVGIERYLSHQIMWQMLLSNPDQSVHEPYTIQCRGGALQQHPLHSLAEVIQIYEQSTEIELIITGCCRYTLMDNFYPLAARKENPARIIHYLHNRPDHPHVLLGSIAAVRRFLPLAGYTAYMADASILTPEALALYDGNRIFCTFVDACGKKRMHHLVLTDAHEFLMTEYRHPSPFLFQIDQLNHHKACLSPIQTQFPESITIDNYVRYAEMNRKWEANHSIFSIKPDIHLPFIHPDILLAAGMRTINGLKVSRSESMKKAVDEMYAIHLQRYRNCFTKKKVTHAVLSTSAMQRFVLTGRLSDHFFALSAFTPAERRKILANLRQQMSENPYFNLYFSKDDSLPFYLEITSYEGRGVMLSNANSSYNLSEGHVESMIVQPEFFQAFQDFFTQELLPNHVIPQQKGLNLMDQWIASLPAND